MDNSLALGDVEPENISALFSSFSTPISGLVTEPKLSKTVKEGDKRARKCCPFRPLLSAPVGQDILNHCLRKGEMVTKAHPRGRVETSKKRCFHHF